jgi:hypothetical protein
MNQDKTSLFVIPMGSAMWILSSSKNLVLTIYKYDFISVNFERN